MLFEVAVKTPLRKLFTYESDEPLQRGMRVKVPFRSREVTGFVWNQTENTPKGLKKIQEVLDDEPLLDPLTLSFYERAALYYGISLGDLLGAAFPKSIREGKAIVDVEPKHFVPILAKLSDAQKHIADSILKDFKKFQSHLIEGETGSGKTEVYLHLIEQILLEDAQTLLLVPEISLTPQLEDRLNERLGAKVTVFHSQISEKKRAEAFARALRGKSDVFLGARSALLLPFRNLKLIVVDEEHDPSFKQSERGPYHARDIALLRAKLFNIPIVLGSATPSLETYYRTEHEKLPHYKMPAYFEAEKPARLRIVDLKKAWVDEGRTFITQILQEAIEHRLQKNEQVLLFMNRRGSASQRTCVGCGSVDECKHCSVTLTIHDDLKRAVCHWCGFQKKIVKKCETCGGDDFFLGGIGTKEIETQIQARFPDARVARLDRDQATSVKDFGNTLRDFASGKIDILVGTQMISKGIDIPKLSLVGVILADQGWGVPDFRGTEKSFQLLKQLRGRAGRRGQESEMIIQTFIEDHPIFKWLKEDKNAYEAFVNEELAIRKVADLPPFCRLAMFTVSDKSEVKATRMAEAFVERFQKFSQSLGVTLIGPAPAPIARWKNQFRLHTLVKAPLRGHLTTFITAVLDELEARPLGVKIKLDRDPYQFM